MKSQLVIPKSNVDRPGAAKCEARDLPPIGSQTAANDEPVLNEKHEKVPNPLWVINIAMAAFFISAALIMMFT